MKSFLGDGTIDSVDAMTVEKRMLAPVVGMMSLVGIVDKSFPLKFGNYCSIVNGPYLCNMWAENLIEWSKRNPDVESIEVTIVSHSERSIGFVSDARLADWCNRKLCVTGYGWPSKPVEEYVRSVLNV